MKIVFVSNYFNHHQKPFCDEMFQRHGSDFFFISTNVMREERKKLGYAQGGHPDYVVLSYESEALKKKAIDLINEADVVITGSAPDEMLTERIRNNKLVFRYSERPFKKEVSLLKRIYHAFNFRKRDLFKKNIYMLCAGAYTPNDYSGVGMYKNRTYKWGYFPEVKEYDESTLFSQKKFNTIMWCGRFIDWKHPDDAVILAKKLKDSGCDFHLNMVGTGVMEDELKKLAENYELTDCVHFLGSMPPEKVRTYMEEAGIYLFTSDRQEGWGAVLNESMNSGCAVVASHAIGSVPFLMKDGENGLVYRSGDVAMLTDKVRDLLDHPEKQNALGRRAYETMVTTWNAEVAAQRLVNLAEHILAGEKSPDLYEDGPCSKAKLLGDDWFTHDK